MAICTKQTRRHSGERFCLPIFYPICMQEECSRDSSSKSPSVQLSCRRRPTYHQDRRQWCGGGRIILSCHPQVSLCLSWRKRNAKPRGEGEPKFLWEQLNKFSIRSRPFPAAQGWRMGLFKAIQNENPPYAPPTRIVYGHNSCPGIITTLTLIKY